MSETRVEYGITEDGDLCVVGPDGEPARVLANEHEIMDELNRLARPPWIRVTEGYVLPPEGADVLVTIRRGGKRWVAAAKAMRRSETAMGFFAFPDPDRPGEWMRDVIAYCLWPAPLEDGEVVNG